MQIVESKVPVLVISFRNGEIHCCHLDGYRDQTEAAMQRLSKIEASFSACRKYRIWFNVDDTTLTPSLMAQIAQCVARLKGSVVKIAFVGAGRKKDAFDKQLNKALQGTVLPKAYFEDAEQAKEWLL